MKVFKSEDIDEVFGSLINTIQNAFYSACLLRQVTLRDNDPPYITPVVRILLKRKNNLMRKGRIREAKDVDEDIRRKIKSNCKILSKIGSLD